MATLRQPARDLPLVGTGSRVLSPAERFPRDFWLTPRTVLTRKTPMSKLQTFCIRHGRTLLTKNLSATLASIADHTLLTL